MTEEPRPKAYPVVIRAAPKLGAVYWCEFPDASHVHLPEMWKIRPVVIVSRKNVLHGKVMALPFSTSEGNAQNPFAIRISDDFSTRMEGMPSWVLCDHITTIATSRLRQHRGQVLRLAGQELASILLLMRSALGSPQP